MKKFAEKAEEKDFFEILSEVPNYEIHDMELYYNLFQYMNNFPNNFDLHKGILLLGKVGSGKTKLMENLQKYGELKGLDKCFAMIKIKDLESEYIKNGNKCFQKYDDCQSICLEDIGEEKIESFNYGNVVNIFEEIVENYYNQWNRVNKKLLHGTTQLEIIDLLQRYDVRIMDRIYEMFNIIILKNESFRMRNKSIFEF